MSQPASWRRVPSGESPTGPKTPRPRILVVCTGNVCRSPLIERLLQPTLDYAFGSGSVAVSSAGTGALVGARMDRRAARVLLDLGGDPSDFLARQLDPLMVDEASLVLTATREHRAGVVRMRPRALRHTFTLRELAALTGVIDIAALPPEPTDRIAKLTELAREGRSRAPRREPGDLDIIDPYRRADDVYKEMRDQVFPAVSTLRAALTPPCPPSTANQPR